MYRRREFIAGSVSLLAVPALGHQARAEDAAPLESLVPEPWIVADIPPGSSVFVAPDGAGDGLAWDSAAPFEAIGDLAERVGGGGQIFLLADSPFYVAEPVRITKGGSDRYPVQISGRHRDGTPGVATIRGTRTLWLGAGSSDEAVDASGFGGNTLFLVKDGASNLIFSMLAVEDVGCVLDMSDLEATGIVLEDVRFSNVRDGVVTNAGSVVSDVKIRRFSGRGFSKKAVRFHGRCFDWLLEDCDLDSGWQYGDNFAVGIEASDEAHGLHISGGRTVNCRDTQEGDPERYWNGDGVATERGNYDILIEEHFSSGHTDAGYDLKSESTRLLRCISEDNKRNYRLWGGIGSIPITLNACESLVPRKRGGSGSVHHLWVGGGEGSYDVAGSVLFIDGTIDGGEAETAIYADGGNAAVHLVDCSVTLPAGTELFSATVNTSQLLLGSVNDAPLTTINLDAEIDVIEGLAKSVPLGADSEATWRLVSVDAVEANINGNLLSITGRHAGLVGDVVVQARDSGGRATELAVVVAVLANPVGKDVVFSMTLDSERNLISDGTGIHTTRMSEGAKVARGSFHFDSTKSFFEIDGVENFVFTGPFSISTAIRIETGASDPAADILTFWKTSGHRRSFRIGLDDRKVSFFWSTTGRAEEANVLTGPVIDDGEFHLILVDRDEASILRLYVDGKMVARTTELVGPFHASNAPLRVSGRSDNKRGANGYMSSLTIINGHALCGSDLGCE